MSEIDELQRRIVAAMARIGTGVEAVSAPAPQIDPGEVEALRQALDDERLANAQMQERLRTLGERHSTELAGLRAQDQTRAAAMKQLDADLQRLRQAADRLRENNDALRAANAEGLADAGLIDEGLRAEVEALRAARAADMSEAGAIMAELGRVLDTVTEETE